MSQSTIPNTFKITSVKTGENRRFPASTTFADLKTSLSSFWGEHPFALTYRDEDGDIITVSTELEFTESLTVARELGSKVLKFNAYLSEAELRAQLRADMQPNPSVTPTEADQKKQQLPMAVHHHVVCDRSGMNPIVGPRYNVPGADYDLCSAEFEKLPETERVLFVKIDRPGSAPVPCDGGAGVKHPSIPGYGPRFCHRGRCPRMDGRMPSPLAAFNMPPSLSVDELILQASIAASLLNERSNARKNSGADQTGESAHPFAKVLSSFIDAAGVAAVNEATKSKCKSKDAKNAQCPAASGGGGSGGGCAPKNANQDCCQGEENPFTVLFSTIGNSIPPSERKSSSPQRQSCDKNAAAGSCGAGSGGSGGGCPMKTPEMNSEADIRSAYQKQLREQVKKIGEQCQANIPAGHPLAHLFAVLGDVVNEADKPSASASSTGEPIHFNVACDKSGMNPIVGPRYTILGANYDLCADEFAKLPESERMLYALIGAPGQEPVPLYNKDSNEKSSKSSNDEFMKDTVLVSPPGSPATTGGRGTAAAAAAEQEEGEETSSLSSSGSKADASKDSQTDKNARMVTETTAEKQTAPTAGNEKKEEEISDAKKYEAELIKLASLGFVDQDANLALLKRYQGRMDRVINFILEL